MATDLTGDYDAVAEFSVPAIDRVLAAMHRGNRFPHSLSVFVEDTPKAKRSARSIVDTSGKAVSDKALTARTGFAASSALAPTDVIFHDVDPVVNHRPDPVALHPDFSELQGVAQLQLGTPAISLPDDGSASATVSTPVVVRYFPDPNTMELPEFMRGEILTTLAVNQAFRFIGVDLAGPGGNIHFRQLFPPQFLTPHQLTAVNKVLRNSLLTGFQPSGAALPDNVLIMHLKTMADVGSASILMDLAGGKALGSLFLGAPNPDSVDSSFLRGNDNFALAVGASFFMRPLTSAVNAAVDSIRIDPIVNPISFGILGTVHITTTVTVDDVKVELQDGRILLTIHVQVRTTTDSDYVPNPPGSNFDFAMRQAFTLGLNGGEVGLELLGGLVFDNLPANFTNTARNMFNQAWNSANAEIQQQIGSAFSTSNLQTFFRKLMNPPIVPVKGRPTPEEIDPQLSYTSFEMKTTGVILHGLLEVLDSPPPHIEFDLNQWTAASDHPEYTALNSWIPGGTVEDYVWSYSGNDMPQDQNTFVSSGAPAIGWAPKSVCLRLEGRRISSSGPVVMESVSARTCKSTSVPNSAVFHGENVGRRPDVGLTQISASGALEIVAHTSPWAPDGVSSGGTANLLVHFPDDKSTGHLDFLTRALAASGRGNTATAIVCVLAPEQFVTVKPVDGLIFADDEAGWEKLLHVRNRPSTYLLDTSGAVVWRNEGKLTMADLAGALEQHLSAGGFFLPQFLESILSVGQRAPNFIFESAPGHELTLRNLVGRQVALIFWKSSSKPSLRTLSNLHKVFTQPGIEGPVVLAINDGEDSEFARGMAAGNEHSAIIVPNPKREISSAYGVNVWPTSIFLDTNGIVKEIRYGLITEEQLKPPVPGYRGGGK